MNLVINSKEISMIVSKTLLKVITLVFFLGLPSLCGAVTDKEMEQARTIAAKAYIRYANDGSGYLDDLNPVTMEELEASLKPKERENIKAFKAIPVPTDYKDWNKDKLLEYWAVTAFKTKGLLEKGRGGRIRARSQINKMTIAPPQPELPAVSQLGTQTTQPASSLEITPVMSVPANKEEQGTDSISQQPIEEFDEDMEIEKARNYNWVYIMVLAILVGVLIALGIYAAKVMKKNGNPEKENGDFSARTSNDDAELRERYESIISDKNVEIAMLKKKLETALRQTSEYKTKIESLTSELQIVKGAAREMNVMQNESKDNGEQKEIAPASVKGTLRTIYLGRANSRGIFVRADRSLNPGHSIFVLDTNDGYTGSYRVVDNPEVWALALSYPQEYLLTACIGNDLEYPENATRIVNESSGMAVFDGGCWRVTRKARIRYE